jgi:hypothetical protein
MLQLLMVSGGKKGVSLTSSQVQTCKMLKQLFILFMVYLTMLSVAQRV